MTNPYTLSIVNNADVPDWERQPIKWAELYEAAESLEVGQSLKITFNDAKTAERARNAIRDTVNLKAHKILVRTRLVKGKGDKTIVYVMRVKST